MKTEEKIIDWRLLDDSTVEVKSNDWVLPTTKFED